MIIYNTTWLANLRLQNEVQHEVDRGNITEAEFKAIADMYPSYFYTPNIFIRICLFLLTCVVILFGEGLISFMFAIHLHITNAGWMAVLCCFTYIAFELTSIKIKCYRCGADDALLWVTFGQALISFVMLMVQMEIKDDYQLISAFTLLLSGYLVLRTADMLLAAIVGVSGIALIFFSWIKYIPSGLATAPFTMMFAGGGMYWLAYQYDKQNKYINYHNCFIVAQVLGLAALYAAGNYYVIQNLSTQMMHKTGPVPFGFVFWAWTIILPFLYIGGGLRKKDVILLRIGLLLVAAPVATFRAYYHVLPVDVALTIAGALLLSIVYGVTRYLKTPKYGFTVVEPDKLNLMDHLKVESLIVAETFAHTPTSPAPAADGVKYGGGSFGGGGSSGDF